MSEEYAEYDDDGYDDRSQAPSPSSLAPSTLASPFERSAGVSPSSRDSRSPRQYPHQAGAQANAMGYGRATSPLAMPPATPYGAYPYAHVQPQHPSHTHTQAAGYGRADPFVPFNPAHGPRLAQRGQRGGASLPRQAQTLYTSAEYPPPGVLPQGYGLANPMQSHLPATADGFPQHHYPQQGHPHPHAHYPSAASAALESAWVPQQQPYPAGGGRGGGVHVHPPPPVAYDRAARSRQLRTSRGRSAGREYVCQYCDFHTKTWTDCKFHMDHDCPYNPNR